MYNIVTDNGKYVGDHVVMNDVNEIKNYLNTKGYKVSLPSNNVTQGSGVKSKSNGSNAGAAAAEYLLKKGVKAYQERRDAKRFEKWVKKKGRI